MAIALRSQSNVAYGASRTSTVLAAPAGLANGDILLASFVNVSTGAPPSPTPPAGFAELGTPTTPAAGGLFGRFSIWWKRAASESGSYTFTHPSNSTASWLGAFSGAKASGTPLGAASSNGGTGQTATGLGITTTAAGSWLMWFSHDWGDLTNNLSPPAGMTEQYEAVILYAASELRAAAAATGDRTMTNNNNITNPWSARMVELLAEPAAAGGMGKVWNGAAWVEKPFKVWNGAAWVQKPLEFWNGSTWQQ